jgi:hypothetical protein
MTAPAGRAKTISDGGVIYAAGDETIFQERI